ncbi:unnamed protein product, partial [Rotaria sordida]
MNLSSIGTPASFSTPDILSNYNRRQVVVSNVIQENQVADDIQKDVGDEIFLNDAESQQNQSFLQDFGHSEPATNGTLRDNVSSLSNVLESIPIDDDNDRSSDETHTLASSSLSNTETVHVYPPVHKTGRIADHDRSYAKYHYFDRATIAELCQFNLQPPSPSSHEPPLRLHRKAFAILLCTDVSKYAVMKHIKQQFDIRKIQYICVGEGRSGIDDETILEIQIIFKKTMNKKKRFLDSIHQKYCNYHVTTNDLGWNEYIKKNLNFIEFREFKSTKTRGKKMWPPASLSAAEADAVATKALAKSAAKAVEKATKRLKATKATAKVATKLATEAAAKATA